MPFRDPGHGDVEGLPTSNGSATICWAHGEVGPPRGCLPIRWQRGLVMGVLEQKGALVGDVKRVSEKGLWV